MHEITLEAHCPKGLCVTREWTFTKDWSEHDAKCVLADIGFTCLSRYTEPEKAKFISIISRNNESMYDLAVQEKEKLEQEQRQASEGGVQVSDAVAGAAKQARLRRKGPPPKACLPPAKEPRH